MDNARDEAIKKLITGQEEMRKDISGLKTDVSDLKHGQQKLEADVSRLKADVSVLKTDVSGLKADVSGLKADVSVLKTDVSELKNDVSDLKHGQSVLEKMMLKMMDELTFVKDVVVKMENDLNPKVKTLFDADNSRQHETTDLKQTCREQEEKLKDHEIRISRLEED